MRRDCRELGAERPVQALICALLRFLRIFQDCAYREKYEISYLSPRMPFVPLFAEEKRGYLLIRSMVRMPQLYIIRLLRQRRPMA
jgi:hypothetical protein